MSFDPAAPTSPESLRPVQEALDRITRLAARILRAPVAQVNVVAPDRQVSLSSSGPEPWSGPREVPLDFSYCKHVAASGEPLLVEDAREHPRVRENRATTESGIVSYAAVPLTDPERGVVGTLCVVDFEPRHWTEENIAILEDLAASVLAKFELVRQIQERRRAEAALQAAHDEMEARVRERTAELEEANRMLLQEAAERKRAEAALREREERYRALIERASDAIIILDEEGAVAYVSPAVERELGYRPEELTGRPAFDLVHPDDLEAVHEVFSGLMSAPGATVSTEYRIRHADGRWRSMETLGTNLLHTRAVQGVVINARDVTDRRAAEEALRESQLQLLQAQKMEAVGRLAGGVAHDFNNVLTAIKGVTQLLLMDLPAGDPLREDLQEVDAGVNRAASLTRQLLAFSRKQVLQPRTLSLNAIARELDRMLRRLIGEDVELVSALDPALGPVRADPGQVEQVIVNLVVNARDAMPRGGTITVETRTLEVSADGAGAPPGVPAGSYALLAVRDTGIGMDGETLERAFEPFFTTKEQGRGTGLGLSTVYGIVQQSGGHVWMESEPGEGTVVNVLLPVVAEETEEDEPGRADSHPGGGTVLLVEDDAAVRRSVRRLLERGGYTVLEAGSGPEAIELCERRGAPVDIVVTDVIMPGMSGPELRERLRARHPGLKVLYMSGYTDDALTHRGALEAGAGFLEKPFSPGELARRVGEIIRGVE